MDDSSRVQRLMELARSNNFHSGEDLLNLSMQEYSESQALEEDVIELGKLNWSPGTNWIEDTPGPGLPSYIVKVAIGIMKSGKTRERAIPIAISRIKRWAAGLDNVNKDTQAKALASLKEWEALKLRNKVRMAKKKKK